MGSAMIPLMGQQAQIPTGEAINNSLAILAGQQQIAAQQAIKTQADQIDLAQKKQLIDDSNTFVQALKANNGDWDKALQQVSGKVGLPAYQNFVTANLNNQKLHAEIDDKTLASRKEQIDQLMAVHEKAMAVPDDQYAEKWPEIAASVNAINPKLALDPNKPIPKNELEGHGIGLQTESWYIDQELKRKQAAEAEAKAAAQNATAAKEKQATSEATLKEVASSLANSRDAEDYKNRLRFYASRGVDQRTLGQFAEEYSPEAVTQARKMAIGPVEEAKMTAQLPDEKSAIQDYLSQRNLPNTPENRNAARVWYEGIKPKIQMQLQTTAGGLIPGGAGTAASPGAPQAARPALPTQPATAADLAKSPAKVNLAPDSGFNLSAVPQQIRPQVQAVLEYRSPMPPQGRNNATNAATRFWVQSLQPGFEEADYPAKSKILNDFTSGKDATKIDAINTAIGHLGELDQAIDGLKNKDTQVLNRLANFYSVQVGDTPVTTFRNIVHKVGPELAAAYIQGGGGEGERGTNEKDYSDAMSPAQLHSNTAEAVRLLSSKIGALEQRWNTTYKPRTDAQQFRSHFLTPLANETINRIGTSGAAGGGGHVIAIGDKQYSYNGSGDTRDLKNYTEIKKPQ